MSRSRDAKPRELAWVFSLIAIVAVCVHSSSVGAEEESGEDDSAESVAAEAVSESAQTTPEPAETPAPDAEPPPPESLGSSELRVVFAQGVADLRPGHRLEAGRTISLAEDDCLRLVAGQNVALGLCGALRARVISTEEGLGLRIESGRGFLAATEEGATVSLGDRRLTVWSATATFDTATEPVAALVDQGRAELDGRALSVNPEVAPRVLANDWCAPPRPTFAISLGDPSEIVGEIERARADAEAGSDQAATAESGATCVDSADSSSASNPNTADGVVVDPSVRRENLGRLRILVVIPQRD